MRLIDLPTFAQLDDWDCGPALVWTVLRYFGLHAGMSYRDVVDGLGTNPKDGTTPQSMLRWLGDIRRVRLIGGPMTVEDLGEYTGRGWAVLCYVRGGSGVSRWVGVRGVEREIVFLQCPRGGRSEVLAADFLDSWWHVGDGIRYDQFGIAVSPM